MSKHTPGPWAVRFSSIGYPYQITAVNGDDKAPGKVGTCVTRWASFMLPSSAEAQANARLIAAAPCLLAALVSLEPLLEAVTIGLGRVWVEADGSETDFGAALDVARAAIAKAEGDPS